MLALMELTQHRIPVVAVVVQVALEQAVQVVGLVHQELVVLVLQIQ
jgi:hypothetical protein